MKQQPRVGIGYDIHRLVEGRKLILGGVEVPFEKGLEGHSDADALCHSICDALLGAAALGDMGQHFPDDDPGYRGISSIALLRMVERLLRTRGFCVRSVDAIILAEAPKMTPFIERFRRQIANALNLSIDSVSVKAKTNEGLGAIGGGDAIAAQAVCVVDEATAQEKREPNEMTSLAAKDGATDGEDSSLC